MTGRANRKTRLRRSGRSSMVISNPSTTASWRRRPRPSSRPVPRP
jgi:hypothetical protein